MAAAVVELRRMAVERPERGLRAAALVGFIMGAEPGRMTARIRHLDELLEMTAGRVPETPEWVRVRGCARAMALMSAVAEHRVTDLGWALRRLDELRVEADGQPGAEQLFAMARAGLETQQAMAGGDIAAIRDLPATIAKMRAGAAGNTAAEAIGVVLGKAAEVAAAQQRGEDFFGPLAELRAAADALPEGHHLRELVEQMTSLIGEPGPGGPQSPAGGSDPALVHAAAGGRLFDGGAETDLGRIDLGIEEFRQALAVSGAGPGQRAFFLFSLALGLLRRSELTNSLADLREVEELVQQALVAAGGPQHQLWPELNEMLAHTRQRLGAESSRKQALEGLRAHTWQVLVQSDLPARNTAARDAATNAVDVARLCIAEGDPDDTIQALDAGRGLALYAATATADVSARLAAAGLSDLARRWRAAAALGPERVPAGLRREVLAALGEHDAAGGLLDPPKPAEIRDALLALDLDALVYLLPGAAPHPGHAIITTAAGESGIMPLPSLMLGSGLAVEADLAALRVRGLTDRDLAPTDTDRLVGGVSRLCDWAWRAAIGPLLERGLTGVGVDRTLPRVVLVPVGELALIPWPAARRPSDGTYAVELAEFSQAASARMLCHSAGLAPVPPSPVGLVVGDPDTEGHGIDLPAARLEAFAVQQTFFRAGRYLGRRPDLKANAGGTGTAGQVRSWLTDTGPAAGAMLHLACHGLIRSDPGAATSYLLLAGGERLAAEELAGLMAAAPARAVGLVVLAACRTGQSMFGYDEAYSLGTAFLAGGARTVLSTRWPIPDLATSALMFMFHRYRVVGGLPPRAALRAAQLWMVDPGREWPPEMPAPLRRVLDPAHLPKVAAWAGFVHWGQ
ncbi:CHAT domain-containing protein [Dactylosporangium sp. NPDC051541]|uniref:CHAT domain-containing protein n=1 Tax=Dactylosporangium sp. NPDC051541 TaxID=3363977 RepID=UPI0037B3099F